MADKKSILEEALLDIKKIQSALNANTKEILRSVAKEEIDSVVKESLNEIYEEEELEPEMGADDSEDGGIDNQDSEEVAPEMGGAPEGPEMGSEMNLGMEPEMGDELELEPEMGMDADALGGDELDMTAASDDDVIAIYKKLSGEDEIEIVGDEIHLKVSEPGEYIVKTNNLDSAPEMGGEMGMEPEMGGDDVDYEIEMGDDEGNEEPSDLEPVEDEETDMGGEEDGEESTEEPIEEKISVGIGMSQGTHRNPRTGGSIGAAENPKSKLDESAARKLVSETTKKYHALLTEARKIKAQNDEFKKALKEFRNKLVETVVFNSNLTYVTRLFMEHSTTKSEKQNIIKRFDEEVSNLKESKRLHKTIANELEGRKPMNESVENKIIKEVTTGSSKTLNETTAYVDPSTKRILDLIKRVEEK